MLEPYTRMIEIHQTLCIFFTLIFRSLTYTLIYKGDGIETKNNLTGPQITNENQLVAVITGHNRSYMSQYIL